ncbi:uncharacterized protein LOC142356963 [Convolutriloba macropyga]|uniref:uncharacterized protein LOC142356963 n=1 Tax=Convolutriloba macropyga TaxID=536237 RepID=UPI003F51D51E
MLSREINRRYPQATLFDIAVRQGPFSGREEKFFLLLGCSEVKSSTLTNKFEDKNVFEYSLFDSKLFCMLFADTDRCDLFFMDYIGFEIGDSEERRIEKYKQLGGNLLFHEKIEYEALQLGVNVLRRYNLLQYEFSRTKDGMTLLQWVVFISRHRIEKHLLDSVRLIVDAGFPDNLLLHENSDNENVLDMSIRLDKSFTNRSQFRHLIGYFIEEKRYVFLGPNNSDNEKVTEYEQYLKEMQK